MATVDDRVVQMQFDNRTFQNGVANTLNMLEKLKKSLDFGTGKKNKIDELAASASKLNLGTLSDHISGVSAKFLALGAIGVTAIANITNRALNAGIQLAKSLTIQPIIDGLHEYETQLNSIQTILANTGLKGASGMGQVNDALNQLNTYSDKTIYNFSEMARNIGTFTAAGVKLKPATESIKGIANLAALSGSSADQASTAMYQLSQAIANNKVTLMDWNSVVNAGMGGKVFQEALFNTAKLSHTLKGVKANTTFDQWTKSGNSFRDSLKDGWLTGEVLTKTLSQFTGDLTDAQLKQMGFTAEQIKGIQEQAKVAGDAATKVKTFTQLMGTLKEAVGSGWSQTFAIIFGNFNEARDLWTGVSNSIGGLIQNSAKARNKVLGDWKALGGRTVLIEGIRKAFDDLGDVIGPIKKAFRDIFPASTGKSLFELTKRFRDFMNNLALNEDTMTNIRRTFRGLFAILDIGKQIIVGVFHVFATLFGVLHQSTGSFLNFTGNIGDMLVAFDKALKKGNLLTNFFDKLATVLSVPLRLLYVVKEAIFALFDGLSSKNANGASKALTGMQKALEPIAKALERARTALSKFAHELGVEIAPAMQSIVDMFGQFGQSIADAMSSGNFDGVLRVINTALLGGILLLVKKFLSGGLSVDIGGGVLKNISKSFDALTGSLTAMQTQIKAKTLLLIAGAIALLTASVVALSLINEANLTKALKAMAVGFGELLGAMAVLTNISKSVGFVKIPLIALSLNLLAGAILILTAAVALMAQLSWSELVKGLTAVGVLLAEVSVATLIISKNSGSMISAGVGITAIAIAINILALAVKQFSKLSWKDLAKGLAGVAGSLVAVAIGMQLMPKGMVAQSAALVLIAGAINALYLAVYQFAKLDWKTMGKGLAGVAGALVAVALGMRLMPKGMIAQAAGLALIAGSLQLIAKAISAMASMSFGTIGKGLGVIAASLLILAGAMHLMQGTLPGAIALVAVSGALAILTGVIGRLGGMKWTTIAKGLGTTAAALALLVAAGYLAEGAALGLAALAAASIALGTGIALAGAGVGALAAGLSLLAATGSAGIAVLLEAITGIIARIPEIATAFAIGLVNILTVIGKNGPAIVKALGAIISSLLTVIIQQAPHFAEAMGVLIVALLKVLVDNAPRIIAAGFKLLMDLLSGIEHNIVQVTASVVRIVIKFINALASHAGEITAAGLNLLIKLLLGISNGLGKVVAAVGTIIVTFIGAVSKQLGRIVTAGANLIINFVTGLGKNASRIVNAGVDAVLKFIEGLGKRGVELANRAAKVVLDFIHGLDAAVKKYEPAIIEAAIQLGLDIVSGIVKGIANSAGQIGGALVSAAGGALKSVGHFLHINSPSLVFAKEIGSPISEGIGHGIRKGEGFITDALGTVTNNVIDKLSDTLRVIPEMLGNIVELNPTITPVLDLSNVIKDAAQIPGMINNVTPISTAASFRQAADISALQQQAAEAAQTPTDVGIPAPVTQLSFEQNNYSPKALSEVEIYRKTKNQLGQAKSALGLVESAS